MKKITTILFLFYFLTSTSQNFYLEINGTTPTESKTIDSITYKKKHINLASIIVEKKKIDSILIKSGYLEFITKEEKKINDSTFNFLYYLGKKTVFVKISTLNTNKETLKLLSLTNDTLKIPFQETEQWITNQLKTLETKGYPLAKIKLINHKKNSHYLLCQLETKLNKQRKTDELVILGYDNFPKNIKKHLNNSIKNKTFNQQEVSKIYNQLNNLPFVSQIKYPEILFTENSTKIYAYINKSKPNKFDGFIGFANDNEEKLVFNGYLDLLLVNALNSGEKFKLFWKNNGNQETMFNLETELPYIFKSSFGIQSELNIFKQDSTFQNTKIDLNAGYYFSFNQKTFIGFQKTSSVDIQNTNTESLQNFENQFFTVTYKYSKKNESNLFLPEKTNISIKSGLGHRNNNNNKSKQFFSQFEISHLIDLNKKNKLLLKNHTYYLNSNDYLTNELYRFGGINSIRGFRENSLQANFFSGIMSEYKYLVTSNLSLHTILDYGYTEDKSIKKQNKLLGIGVGFELLTNNGLFHFIYSNGTNQNQNIKLSNSIIQISYKAIF
ncbi:hypothetical protein [Flavobacterium sp. J27]|uniref:hypothetical protein n=1 Tax=Flavobacterium sp. J27 TaxID=2060419 RepID=UPI00102F6CC4|nr:hypothetical protein [Flavobacterium sp. J27]